MKYELRNYSFGETLGKGFNLYFDNLLFLMIVSLVLYAPSIFFLKEWMVLLAQFQDPEFVSQNIIRDSSNIMTYLKPLLLNLGYYTLIAGVSYVVVMALIVNVVSKKYLGGQLSLKNHFTGISRKLLPLLGLIVLFYILGFASMGIPVGLLVLVGVDIYIAILISTLLLFVPLIIFMLGYSLSFNVLIIEDTSIINSMKRSWTLTKGKKWYILGILVLLGLIVGFVTQIIVVIIGAITVDIEITVMVSIIVSVLTNPISICMLVVVYFNFRVEKEGFNAEHLAEQFSLSGDSE
ncbi:MAG TPA: hypothetical protein ENI73_03935 [Spirochaetes bacterium]|nr:hypothetical protein [Spirochaetota bacterium]